MPVASRKQMFRLSLVLISIFLLLSLPAFFLSGAVKTEGIRDTILSFGIYAPLFFILIASVSNILPSVAAMPFWLVGVTLFGPPAYIYILISNTFGSLVNYYLAKNLGRLVVQKFVGKAGLSEIDRLADLITPRTIFLLRLVGGVMTDYISYAAGLMRIDAYLYLTATVVGSLPMMAIAFFLIHRSLESGLLGTAGYLGLFYLINYLSTLFVIPLFLDKIKKIT